MAHLLGKDTQISLWATWTTVRFADMEKKTHNLIASYGAEVAQAYEEIWYGVF